MELSYLWHLMVAKFVFIQFITKETRYHLAFSYSISLWFSKYFPSYFTHSHFPPFFSSAHSGTGHFFRQQIGSASAQRRQPGRQSRKEALLPWRGPYRLRGVWNVPRSGQPQSGATGLCPWIRIPFRGEQRVEHRCGGKKSGNNYGMIERSGRGEKVDFHYWKKNNWIDGTRTVVIFTCFFSLPAW